MDRREMLGMGLAGALLPGAAGAQTEPGYLPGDSQEFIALWPGTPPGGEGIQLDLNVTDAVQPDGFHVRAISQIQTPGFFVYRPAKPNGLGLLIIPGGGYASEGGDRGGREIAQHFASLGIIWFVLRYRLPGEGWKNRATRAARGRPARHAPDPRRRIWRGQAGRYRLFRRRPSVGVAGHPPRHADLYGGQPGRPAGCQAQHRGAHVSGDHHGRGRTCGIARQALGRKSFRWMRSPTGRWSVKLEQTRRRPSSALRRMTKWCRHSPTASPFSASCATPRFRQNCMCSSRAVTASACTGHKESLAAHGRSCFSPGRRRMGLEPDFPEWKQPALPSGVAIRQGP